MEENAVVPHWNYWESVNPSELKPGHKYYRQLSYFQGQSRQPCKMVWLDPSGGVRSEVDNDMPAGAAGPASVHARTFREDGSIGDYTYWKDGRIIEAVGHDRGGIQKLQDGRGVLRSTSPEGRPVSTWYFHGREFLIECISGGPIHMQLNAGDSDVLAVNDKTETLTYKGEVWSRDAGEGGKKWVKTDGGFADPDHWPPVNPGWKSEPTRQPPSASRRQKSTSSAGASS